jgi:gluconolactonase
MWHPPPAVAGTRVFTRLPDAFRRPGRRSAWAEANKQRPLHSFLEGPAFDEAGNLFVADIPWGRIFRVAPDGAWTLVTEYDGEPNGLAFAPDGTLHIADYRHGILKLDLAAGKVEPLIERRRSERFKGPNDLCFASDGTLYFTDQGQTGLHDPTGRVYRLTPDGRLDCLIDNAPSPNGLALSADETILVVAMTRDNRIWRIPLLREGGTAKVHAFVTLSGGTSGPDGLAFDAEGNLSIAHASLGVVWQVDRDGLLRRMWRSCAGRGTTNLAYGGVGLATLFITESETGTILMADTDVPGKPLIQRRRREEPQ